MPLPAGTNSIDRLVVFGVLGSLDPTASATRLSSLLVGHHYSSGLELLPIGTPTKNPQPTRAATPVGTTNASPSKSSAKRPHRQTIAMATCSERTRRSGGHVRGVAHSNDGAGRGRTAQRARMAMAMGYWLDSLVQPGPTDAIIADIRRHALQMLRGRGPLPPLRIGTQPTAAFPPTSLAQWQPANDPAGVQQVVRFLRGALPWWKDGIAHAPVVRANTNPDQGVLDALSQLPVSKSVGVRSMVGANASFIPMPYEATGTAAQSAAAEGNRQRSMARRDSRHWGSRDFRISGSSWPGRIRSPRFIFRTPSITELATRSTEHGLAGAGGVSECPAEPNDCGLRG